MLGYIVRRLASMLVVLVLVSILSFLIIQLPPGDFVTRYVEHSSWLENKQLDEEAIARLNHQYGFDLPPYQQYFKWIFNMMQGDFGVSFTHNRPVSELLVERLPYSLFLSLLSTLFVYLVAIPIGIYSATHQYSLSDYAVTVAGFIGLATPNFLLALALVVFLNRAFDIPVGSLFSPDYLNAPWSFERVWDLVKHLPVPIVVVGTAGTAGLIRVMRAGVLDEMRKQYVVTARSKGVSETRLTLKYPVRVALNPVVSSLGFVLPAIVSGETITSIVLGLPTIGPLLFSALLAEDMYLAGSTVMILTFTVVIGVALSDILLAVLDPRIRLD